MALETRAKGVGGATPIAPVPSGSEVGGQPVGDAPLVRMSGIRHWFLSANGKMTLALDDVDLNVERGEFVALVGPSGCGKTTALNMMAGLVRPEAGTVSVGGEILERPSALAAYMFARDCLLPWRSAQRNAELGLELRGVERVERRRRAAEMLKLVGLGDRRQAFPMQLSQGMRQRVAIARTLAQHPQLLLLDEPFAALDAQTRLRVQRDFLALLRDRPSSVVLVTHDLEEAVKLADRVVVFSSSPGRIVAEFRVPFGRDRDLEELPFDPIFTALCEQVHDELRGGM